MAHDLLHLFRIEFLRHGRIAGQVREKDGHMLPFAVWGGDGLCSWKGLVKLVATIVTESGLKR